MISNPRYVFIGPRGEIRLTGGLPMLRANVNGALAKIEFPQKYIFYGFPAAFLGPDWVDKLPPVSFPGDESRGLTPQTLRGYTTDQQIVAYAQAFDAAVRAGTFKAGPAPTP